jgi:hypothetical protein
VEGPAVPFLFTRTSTAEGYLKEIFRRQLKLAVVDLRAGDLTEGAVTEIGVRAGPVEPGGGLLVLPTTASDRSLLVEFSA